MDYWLVHHSQMWALYMMKDINKNKYDKEINMSWFV